MDFLSLIFSFNFLLRNRKTMKDSKGNNITYLGGLGLLLYIVGLVRQAVKLGPGPGPMGCTTSGPSSQGHFSGNSSWATSVFPNVVSHSPRDVFSPTYLLIFQHRTNWNLLYCTGRKRCICFLYWPYIIIYKDEFLFFLSTFFWIDFFLLFHFLSFTQNSKFDILLCLFKSRIYFVSLILVTSCLLWCTGVFLFLYTIIILSLP